MRPLPPISTTYSNRPISATEPLAEMHIPHAQDTTVWAPLGTRPSWNLKAKFQNRPLDHEELSQLHDSLTHKKSWRWVNRIRFYFGWGPVGKMLTESRALLKDIKKGEPPVKAEPGKWPSIFAKDDLTPEVMAGYWKLQNGRLNPKLNEQLRNLFVADNEVKQLFHQKNPHSVKSVPKLTTEAVPTIKLRNLGNTCFIDAPLQALFHIPEIAKILGTQEALTSQNPILSELAKIYQQKSDTTQVFINTAQQKGFYMIESSQRGGYKQADTQEFVTQLLNHIHEATKNPSSVRALQRENDPKGEAPEQRSKRYRDNDLQINNSPIARLFRGQLETSPGTFDPFETYNVTVPDSQRPVELQYLMLDTSKITVPPPYLMIQLGRFGYDQARQEPRRLNTQVNIPDILDNGQYELVSIVNHRGESSNSGHYTTDVRNPSTGQWQHFDDLQPNNIAPRRMGTGNQAYLVFYRRKQNSAT